MPGVLSVEEIELDEGDMSVAEKPQPRPIVVNPSVQPFQRPNKPDGRSIPREWYETHVNWQRRSEE